MRKLGCEEAEPLLAAFEANELDGVTSLAVQEHLDECPLCQQRRRWNAEADASLRRLADTTPAASSGLRARILAIAQTERRVIPARFQYAALAVAAVIIALLGFASLWHFSTPDAMAFVENHISTLAKSEPVELRTSDAVEAEQWLRARLPFAPIVPRTPDYHLVGARLCEVNKAPVAFLLYERDGNRVSCFVTADSQTRLRGFDATAANRVRLGTCDGQNIAAWDADHSGYLLVGDLPRESLVAFANHATRQVPQQPADSE
jgi:anti-sigma factor RsiW